MVANISQPNAQTFHHRSHEASASLGPTHAIQAVAVDVIQEPACDSGATRHGHLSTRLDELQAQSFGYWNDEGEATWRSRRHIYMALTAGVYCSALVGIVVGCMTGMDYGTHRTNAPLGVALGLGIPAALSVASIGVGLMLDSCTWRGEVARRRKLLGTDDQPSKRPLFAALREAVHESWHKGEESV